MARISTYEIGFVLISNTMDVNQKQNVILDTKNFVIDIHLNIANSEIVVFITIHQAMKYIIIDLIAGVLLQKLGIAVTGFNIRTMRNGDKNWLTIEQL